MLSPEIAFPKDKHVKGREFWDLH